MAVATANTVRPHWPRTTDTDGWRRADGSGHVDRPAAGNSGKLGRQCAESQFKDWPKVFPDALNAQVIAERLTERAEHFVFDGKGYRPTKR